MVGEIIRDLGIEWDRIDRGPGVLGSWVFGWGAHWT
jgi:hypothetical protein